MLNKQNCQPLGTIIKTHGVEGEVTLRLLPHIESEGIDADFLFLNIENGLVPFKIDSQRDRGDGSLLLGFDDVSNEPLARRLLGVEVWIDNADYQPNSGEDGVIHSSLLVGYNIEDDAHGYLGKITELRDPERNPLFVIDGKKGEILIPVVDEFITNIDQKLKIVYVSTPDGLIDLNFE